MIHHTTESDVQSQQQIKACRNSIDYDKKQTEELTKFNQAKKEMSQQFNTSQAYQMSPRSRKSSIHEDVALQSKIAYTGQKLRKPTEFERVIDKKLGVNEVGNGAEFGRRSLWNNVT